MNSRQYTIRAVPDRVDREVRRLAAQQNKSLNAVVLDALERGLELETAPQQYHDLDFLIGTWVEDPAFDEAIAAFEQVDEGMWK